MGNHPAVAGYEEAAAYCKHLGMRLPTRTEWEFIAGKTRAKYPWGDGAVDAGGVYRANFESLDDGYTDLAPVDAFSRYASPCGAVNMLGNLPEWVAEKEARGGGFLTPKEALDMSTSDADMFYTGFRCVMEVKK